VPTRSFETVLSPPLVVRPVTEIRSALLLSSVQTLRSRGHFEAYRTRIDPAHRDAILATSAPSWLPIGIAMAHYEACDALGLDAKEMKAMGGMVGARINSTFLKAIAEGVRFAGVTPWTLLGHFRGLWARLFQGGSIAIGRVSAKECVVEVRGLPLVRYEYARIAFTGIIGRAIEFGGGPGALVKVLECDPAEGEITFEGTWP
jgi:hypothetical protein